MKLHLGCGGNTFAGWFNIDCWPQAEKAGHKFVKHDLTKGLPENVADGSVDVIFTEHFLEHITRAEAVTLLKACYAKLKAGGTMRIIVPDLMHLTKKYFAKDLDWGGPGGWQPASPAIMMNEGMRAWGHQFMYDIEELWTVCKEAGFSNFTEVRPGESRTPEMNDIDARRDANDVRIEVWKS